MVREYTCTLCGFSTRDHDELKEHMRIRHGRGRSGKVKENAPRGAEDPSKETDVFDESEKGGLVKGKEHRPSRETGGQNCVFCNKSFRDTGELVKHVMTAHRDRIEEMSGLAEGAFPSDLGDLLGQLGNITAMILSQLGPMFGGEGKVDVRGKDGVELGEPGDLRDMMDDLTGGEGPPLSDIMDVVKIGVELDMDGEPPEEGSGDLVKAGDEEEEAGDAGNAVKKCPNCGNYMEVTSTTCPFCENKPKE